MQPMKRDFVSIDDLGNEEILALFHAADEFNEDLTAHSMLCPGTILATLFFEASTRTRLSFESAMHRLGGDVISATEGSSMSSAKGESLADTARVVGGRYADLIVLRHPDEGAARVTARYADVPVINAGDGAHEHPTQTLCDLYTLWKEKGKLRGLEIVLCGDLRYSRTVHSLAYALSRFEARIVCVPFPGFEIPEHVLERLRRDWNVEVSRADIADLPGIGHGKDAVYITPSSPHQQSLFTKLSDKNLQKIDAIYMTRSQRERHENEDKGKEDYMSLGPGQLRESRFKDTRVMHPLPRVDEISYELDADPRAIYFRQAALGVPIRMALLAFLLGKLDLHAPAPAKTTRPVYSSTEGVHCKNPCCVTRKEGKKYLRPEFVILRDLPPLLRCVFCDFELEPSFVGHLQSKKLHRSNAPDAARIRPERRVYFLAQEDAAVKGFGENL